MIQTQLLSLLTFILCFSTQAQSYFTQKGEASYYADKFIGRKTANGEIFVQDKLTAAHNTLPFGTKLKVTNLKNNKSIIVKVNDRGPFSRNRILDLTKLGAQKLDFVRDGVAKIKIEKINNLRRNPKVIITPKVKPKVIYQAKKIIKPQPKIIPSKKEKYFKVSSKLYTPSGFGIQLASYTELNNALSLIDQLTKKVKYTVFIKPIVNKNKSTTYKVIVGEFKERNQAKWAKRKFSSYYKGCFVTAF